MNIRYPIYEGVYRILTFAYGNMPALQQGDHSRVSARPVPFVGNAHQPPLQDIHPHCKNNYCPDRHGHACIILKA